MNNDELRKKYSDFLDNFWNNLDDNQKLESIDKLYELFDDSYITDEYGEHVINVHDFYYMIWKKQSPEIQEASSRELLDKVKTHLLDGDIKLRNDDDVYRLGVSFELPGSGLGDIFNSLSEEVKTELFETLRQIMPIDKYPFKDHKAYFNIMMRRIWMDASKETQANNPDMLSEILSLSVEDYETEMSKTETQREAFSSDEEYTNYYNRRLQDCSKKLSNDTLDLLRHTQYKLPKDQIEFFIQHNPQMKNNPKYNIDELYSLYEQIYEYNNSLNFTLDLETLANLGNEIDIMKLIRISSTSTNLQNTLATLVNQSPVTKSVVIDTINDEYWDTELSSINENFHSYRNFFKNIDNENIDLTHSDIENLKNIMLQVNYFKIENLEDLRNYNEIKNNICTKILSDKNLDEKYVAINKMNREEKQKFAILELQYGISLTDAINIVEKYGTDIDEINDPQYAEIISQIKNIKTIVNAPNIAQLYEEHKHDLDTFFGKSQINISTLENESLNLYAKIYQKDFDAHSMHNNIVSGSEVEYDDSTIQVSKISPYKLVNGVKKRGEISTFARVEGAYANWQEPEDFQAALDVANITYHGNCKSLIRSNSLAIARPSGPIFAYDNCPQNSLKLMAPWDIVSTSGNTSFAINSLKWNQSTGFLTSKKISGVQFRTPQNNTDHTRHGHNEATSERLIVNGKKFTKDEPNSILFITEAGEKIEDYEELLSREDFADKLALVKSKEQLIADQNSSEQLTDDDYKILNAERWRISKKAAKQLNKSINAIDRDEFRECEETRFKQLLEAFNNPKKKIAFIEETDSTLSQAELLERIVVEFENNVTGSEFSRNKGIFVDQNREKLFDIINKKVNSYKKSNPSLYEELSQKLAETYSAEYKKSYSNLGKEVSSPEFKAFYLQKHLDLQNKREYETGSAIQTLSPNEQGIQYYSKTRSMIEKINNTDFYEGNRSHSIEHIDKTLLFAGTLAKNEGLDERTTDILLLAAAFHDCGRKREKERNSYAGHAWEGLIVLDKFLKEHPENEFGITKEIRPIIDVSIQYHEYAEPEIGKINLSYIEKLCENSHVRPEDFETAVKVSQLLHDADALDRERFSHRGKLDIRYLESGSARKASMISYAQEVNRAYAKEILLESYNISESELDGKSPVDELFDKRKYSRRSSPEEHLPLSKRLDIMQSTKSYEPEQEEKTSILMKLYDKFGVDKQSVADSKGFIKRTLDKIKTTFIERS